MKRLRRGLSNFGRAVAPTVGLITLCFALSPTLSEAKTVYVQAGATGAATGVSWADAYTSLQDGLAAAVAGDELWVAAGTYKPDHGGGNTLGDNNASFNLKADVAVYGGFSGSETTLAARDWNKNKTILSGDLAGDDQPDWTNKGENSLHVVTFIKVGVNYNTFPPAPLPPFLAATLDGVTITGGNANYQGSKNRNGGGLVTASTSPTIRNTIISGNAALESGGVFMAGGSPTFENCIIQNNQAEYYGGFYLVDVNARISQCAILNNFTRSGYFPSLVIKGSSTTSTISHSIIWGHRNQVMTINDGSSILYSDIQGGLAGFSNGSNLTYQNNIDTDPLLTADGHLQPTSPCIDTGDPASLTASDIDGEARPAGLALDIGPDEFVDSDGDQLPDRWEMKWAGNLTTLSAGDDNDQDGLTNTAEYLADTNPLNPDTDGDGFPDPEELQKGSNPAEPRSFPARHYVNLKAAGNNTGVSWTNAHSNLQDALRWVQPGYEVWVAAGTYKPDQGTGFTPENRAVSFALKSGVALLGGFKSGETEASQRNWRQNLTILSGDLKGDDQPGFVNYSDNSAHVLTGGNLGPGTMLDGFTITGAENIDYAHLYSYFPAGGGMYLVSSTVSIQNCIFTKNRSSYKAGALYAGSSEVTITQCLFDNNLAAGDEYTTTYGGAIMGENTLVHITNSTIMNNTAGDGSGVIHTYTFINHTAENGGGIYVNGTITADNCLFQKNFPNGLYSYGTSTNITNSVFVGHPYEGMVGSSAHQAITNSIFRDNGVGMDLKSATDIVHCTIVDNASAGMIIAMGTQALNITNSLIWGNTPPSRPLQISIISGSPTGAMRYNDIQGGLAAITFGTVGATPTFAYENNIDVPPLLNASGHLSAGSLCIDAGDPATPALVVSDIDGETRPAGSAPDLGADEFVDADNDTLPDFWENTWLGGLAHSGSEDSDHDGLTNSQEYARNTNPMSQDTDNDGYSDFLESEKGTDPLDSSSYSGRLHVKADAAGAATGASWGDAYTSLQEALTASGSGFEIWIAAGTYKPDQGRGIIPGDQGAAFKVKAGVTVLGGFAGTETASSQRDWNAGKTILSGDLLGDDSQYFTNMEENSYSVVVFSGTFPMLPAVLDGVTVTGGHGRLGAGLLLSNQTLPLIRNCIITGNVARGIYSDEGWGGGIFSYADTTRLENCIIHNNTATVSGGGIHLNSGELLISGSTLINNSSHDSGGGIYITSGSVQIAGSIVWGNTAPIGGGAQIYNSGAALTILSSDIQGGEAAIMKGNTSATVTVTNSIDADPLLTRDGHLLPGSPCIDTADPLMATATDIDNEPRPQGATPDMGADEFVDTDGDGLADAWERSRFGGLTAKGSDDADQDGLTNLDEYHWGTNPTNPDTDSDGYSDLNEVQKGTDPLAAAAYPCRIHVNKNATGLGNGKNWADAYTSLQDGLASAAFGCEVWVAAGTYIPDQGVGITPGDRLASFILKPEIDLYGGFSGIETDLSQRDWNKNRTILSGDLLEDDGPAFANTGENSAHVVRWFTRSVILPMGATTILDGVTVTSGNAANLAPWIYGDNASYGGGILVEAAETDHVNLAIRNCALTRNQATSGGGIYLSGTKALIENCTMTDNVGTPQGGAMHINSAEVVIADSFFTRNNARITPFKGGPPYSYNSKGEGGAIYIAGNSATTVERSLFEANTATTGGALFSTGMTGEFYGYHNQIVGNSYTVKVRTSVFKDNTATEEGGGVMLRGFKAGYQGSAEIADSLFEGNSATAGGGICNSLTYYVPECYQYDYSMCIGYTDPLHPVQALADSPLIVTGTTLRDNSATQGPGIYAEGTTTITNSILWNNIAPDNNQVISEALPVSITYSDVMNTLAGTGNISVDPLFTADGHLRQGSPCINAGNPAAVASTDIDGETRPAGAGFDMGADEFIDTDGDGLPDSWEIRYGLDPNDNGSVNARNGASGDPDNDGYTNLQEYVNGTSPLVAYISPDDDGDGYTVDQGDCNDANAAVHPGAAENCSDGLDNDCNGLIDAADPVCAPTYGMGCLYDAQCGSGLYCKKAEGICDGAGTCQPQPAPDTECPLTLVYAPVCGCDGKTYAGACEAGLAGVNVAAKGECATAGYKWSYYFPSVKDNDAIGWENYLSVQAKEPVTMAVTIRVYDLAGNLAGTFIYSDTDPAARAKAIAPYARVALRPSLITGGAIEGSIVVETSVPAIASTNCIASYYKGFSIYEAARVKPIHYFPKAYDGPDFYQVYIVVQNIFAEPRKVTAVLSGKTTSSPGHGTNQTTMIPPHGTWKFRPSDIAGGINFDGSVAVFSDLATSRDALGPPIPAMCRYEAGTDALAIYESTARQPRLFFPVLKDGKFGTTLDYQNYMSVVNMNPQAANVTVVLYNKSGVEEGRITDTIPASGKKTWRPCTIKGTGAAPADFEGLVVIISDLTLIGQTNTIYPGTNKYGADAFDLFESAMRNKTLFFPKAYDNLLGAGTGATHLTDNVVYVSNPDGSYKNLKIEQFNNNGTANGAANVSLAPFSTHVYRPKNLVTDNSGVFRGSVKVTETSGQPITGAIKYEIHKTTDPGSGIEAMSIYRSMGQ